MRRNANCCLCGAPRRPTVAPVGSFGNDVRCIAMKDHRPLQAGRWEDSPQLLVSVNMWRNGGTNEHTHMCDDCIIVGLKAAKAFVDESLAQLAPDTPTDPG